MVSSVPEIPLRTLRSGFSLPAYGLGTWGMGGRLQRDEAQDSVDVDSIRAAIDMGVTHIDTAEMYGEGHAEELVGTAIKGCVRERLFIASKALADHLSRTELRRAAEESLRRLDTPYLDLYMVHHPSDEIPLAETMEGMDELVRRGLVRHVGVSNFGVERLAEARRVSPQPVVTNQVHYNLQVRDPEQSGLLGYCAENDILLVAWRPVSRVLEGEGKALLENVARRYGATPVQAALNWLLSQPNVAVLARTRSIEHLRENLDAFTWQMSPDDVELLRSAFPGQMSHSSVYALR